MGLAKSGERSAANRMMIVLLIGAALCAAAVVIAPYDVRISRSAVIDGLRGDVRKFLDFSEAFGHGFGAVLSVLLILFLAPWRRREMPRMIGTLLFVALITETLKRVFDRLRPGAFWTVPTDQVDTWQTVEQIRHTVTDPQLDWNYLTVSFPSGHSASAAALAVILGYLYPRGIPIYWILAIGTFLQRIYYHAHWPSDVLAGAAIGMVVAQLIYAMPLTRWELQGTRAETDVGPVGKAARDGSAATGADSPQSPNQAQR